MDFENALKFFEEHLSKDKLEIADPTKLRNVINSYRALDDAIHAEGEDIYLEIHPGALELGDVFIRIITPQLTSYQTILLAEAISKADNIDIYPTTDERIKVDLMFEKVYHIKYL